MTPTNQADGERPDLDAEARRTRRFGWTGLFLWALLGLLLEGAHGFKIAFYLDDELTRSLLRLAHAHGVGLSLVLLVYAGSGIPLLRGRRLSPAAVGRPLRVAALMMPFGFGAAVLGHTESDPGIAIVLVPVGAAFLLWALARLAWLAWTTSGPGPLPPDGEDSVDR